MAACADYLAREGPPAELRVGDDRRRQRPRQRRRRARQAVPPLPPARARQPDPAQPDARLPDGRLAVEAGARVPRPAGIARASTPRCAATAAPTSTPRAASWLPVSRSTTQPVTVTRGTSGWRPPACREPTARPALAPRPSDRRASPALIAAASSTSSATPSVRRRSRCARLVLGAERQLALDDRQHVDRHAGVVLQPAVRRGQHVALQPLADRLDQLAGSRHVVGLHHRPSNARNRSCSFSHTRRPMAASSWLRATPLRWALACMMHMIPHFIVPSTSHQRTTSRSTAARRRLPRTRRTVARSHRRPPPARRAETPRLDAQPAEVLHRIADVDQLPVEHRPQTVVRRRSRCRGGSRRARRPTARWRAVGLEPAKRQLERRVRLAERVEHLAVVLDLIGLRRGRESPSGRSRGSATSASASCAGSTCRACSNSSSRRILRGVVSPSTPVTIMYAAPSRCGSVEAVTTSAAGTPAGPAARDGSRSRPPCRATIASALALQDQRPAIGLEPPRLPRRATRQPRQATDLSDPENGRQPVVEVIGHQPANERQSGRDGRVRVDRGTAAGMYLEVQVRNAELRVACLAERADGRAGCDRTELAIPIEVGVVVPVAVDAGEPDRGAAKTCCASARRPRRRRRAPGCRV